MGITKPTSNCIQQLQPHYMHHHTCRDQTNTSNYKSTNQRNHNSSTTPKYNSVHFVAHRYMIPLHLHTYAHTTDSSGFVSKAYEDGIVVWKDSLAGKHLGL